jgi:hypothetical protein
MINLGAGFGGSLPPTPFPDTGNLSAPLPEVHTYDTRTRVEIEPYPNIQPRIEPSYNSPDDERSGGAGGEGVGLAVLELLVCAADSDNASNCVKENADGLARTLAKTMLEDIVTRSAHRYIEVSLPGGREEEELAVKLYDIEARAVRKVADALVRDIDRIARIKGFYSDPPEIVTAKRAVAAAAKSKLEQARDGINWDGEATPSGYAYKYKGLEYNSNGLSWSQLGVSDSYSGDIPDVGEGRDYTP